MEQFLRVEWRPAGEQFVKQDAERVDVRARIDIQAAHLRLLGTHIGGRAHKLRKGSEERLVS